MFTVSFTQLLGHHRVGAGAWGRWKPEFQCAPVNLIHFNKFQFLEHSHTRLHLIGFRVGALETFDELFCLGNHLLLVVISSLLLLPALSTQLQIFAVIYLVIVNLTHCNFNGSGGDMVYKGFVV